MAKAKRINPNRMVPMRNPKNLLANKGDPLATPDGGLWDPDPPDMDELPDETPLSHSNPEQFKPTKTRTIKELPGDPMFMRGVAVIFVLTVLGLSETEMAMLLSVDVRDIRKVKASQAYAETFELVVDQFVNANSQLLKSRIAAYSHLALNQVVKTAIGSKYENLRLKGSQDLLNRAGATAETLEKQGSAMAELRINITKSDEQVQVDVDAGPRATVNGPETRQ